LNSNAPEKKRGLDRALLFAFPLLVFAVALYLSGAVALLGLDMHHDGLMYDAARNLIHGEMPYRDFFYQYNIGTLFFHALSLKILGDSIASLKIATSVTYALLAVVLYFNIAFFEAGWKAFTAAVGWATLSPFFFPALNGYHAWSTYYMMLAISAGTLFLVRSTRGSLRSNAFAAGVCFCAAFWFKQLAMIQIAAAVAWMGIHSISGAKDRAGSPLSYRAIGAWFLAGGLVLFLPVSGYLLAAGTLKDWWLAVFLFNSKFAVQEERESILSIVRLFFPVGLEFGYISVFWAVLPVYLLVAGAWPAGGRPLIFRHDLRSKRLTLYFLLAMAGWIEYFPLPHPFHLHLYMAPAICFAAIHIPGFPAGHSAACQKGMFVFFVVVAFLFSYETLRHVKAFYNKVYRGDYVSIPGNYPVSGLRVDRKVMDSISNFCTAHGRLASVQSGAAIPFSVDPVQAALPYRRNEFKMPVDWTWVNGLLEPSFHAKRAAFIREKKSILYTDGILAIPGYKPVAMLEIPSPFSNHQTLYSPDAEDSTPPADLHVDRETFSRDNAQSHYEATRQCTDPLFQNKFLIRFSLPRGLSAGDITEMHATLISDGDFPQKLDRLEYELFFIPSAEAMEIFPRVDHLYSLEQSQYRLHKNLDEKSSLGLGKFLLFHGKKFPRYYATTLAGNALSHPILLLSDGGRCPYLIWSKSWHAPGRSIRNRTLFLALPFKDYFFPDGMLRLESPMTIYLQCQLRDDTTRSYYIRIGSAGSGQAAGKKVGG
jgi:hypothetical protein